MLTPLSWKRRKTSSFALLCATCAWGLTRNNLDIYLVIGITKTVFTIETGVINWAIALSSLLIKFCHNTSTLWSTFPEAFPLNKTVFTFTDAIFQNSTLTTNTLVLIVQEMSDSRARDTFGSIRILQIVYITLIKLKIEINYTSRIIKPNQNLINPMHSSKNKVFPL